MSTPAPTFRSRSGKLVKSANRCCQISGCCSRVSFAALALPPFSSSPRPSDTAAESLPSYGSGSNPLCDR
jgi:hypothetical protein